MLLILKNFRCWAYKELEIDDGSITLLAGKSGAGKSTIIEAIAYVLFGQIKNVTPSQAKSRSKTEVTLKLKNQIITRTSKPKSLLFEIDKNPFYGEVAQKEIDKIWGNYEVWVYSSYLSRFSDAFCYETPAKQLEIMEQLSFSFSDLHPKEIKRTFFTISKKAREELLTHRAILDHVTNDLKAVNERFFSLKPKPQNEIEEEMKKKEDELRLLQDAKRLRERLKYLKIECSKMEPDITLEQVDEKINILKEREQNEKKKEMMEEFVELSNSLEKYDIDKVKADYEYGKRLRMRLDKIRKNMNMKNIESEIQNLRSNIKQLEEKLNIQPPISVTCPKCGFHIVHKGEQSAPTERDKDGLKAKIEALSRRISDLDECVKNFEIIKSIEKNYELISKDTRRNALKHVERNDKKVLDEENKNNKEDDVKETMSELVQLRKRIMYYLNNKNKVDEMKNVEERVQELDSNDRTIEQVNNELKMLKKEFNEHTEREILQKRKDELEAKCADEKVVVEQETDRTNKSELVISLCKDSELQTVRQTLENLRVLVEFFIQKFISEDTEVYMEADEKRITTEIRVNGVSYPFAKGFSGGEMDRVKLSFTLSFALLFSSKILLLDECLGSLDYDTNTFILTELRKILPHHTIIAIQHNSGGFYDKFVDVCKC